MKRNFLIKLTLMACFILVLILGACYPYGEENEGILVGTYYADYTEDEYINVTSSGIYMHIRYRDPKSLAGQYIDRKFSYRLSRQGEIVLPMATGDPVLEELGFNYWYWRDGKIVRKHWKTGKESFFTIRKKKKKVHSTPKNKSEPFPLSETPR